MATESNPDEPHVILLPGECIEEDPQIFGNPVHYVTEDEATPWIVVGQWNCRGLDAEQP